MFLIIIPVIVPYMQEHGLSMQELLTLLAVFSATAAILEVPSGYLADIWGRKKTLVVGGVFNGLGCACLLFADSYMDFLLFEFLMGVAMSLVSGSDLAMIYDSQLALKKSGNQGQASTRIIANLQLSKTSSEAIASVLCGVLVLWGLELVALAQVIAGWGPFLVALTLTEPPYRKMQRQGHRKNFAKIMRHILFDEQILRMTFLALTCYGLASYIIVWIYQKYWQVEGIHLAYFGYLWAAMNLLVGVVGKFAHSLRARIGMGRSIMLIGVLPILGYALLGSTGGWLGVAIGFIFPVSRGLTFVLIREAFNQRIPSEFRATANSLASFAFRGTFVVVGPVLGYCIDNHGVAFTLHGLALVYVLVFLLVNLPFVMALRNSST